MPNTFQEKNDDIAQNHYIHTQFMNNSLHREHVCSVAASLGDMHTSCCISICIPAYQEWSVIYNTLEHYTIWQITPDGKPLHPDMFEINILINRPNPTTPIDKNMLEEIKRFQTLHPEYHIHTAEVVYDFGIKPKIGQIFKDIVDAVILRNTKRTVSTKAKERIIIRTAGADVEALNPLLLSRTISIFEDQTVIAHRWETHLPPELLRNFPLLDIIQTASIFLLRQYHGPHIINGPFSYLAEAYAIVWGFDGEKYVGEEMDLSERIHAHAKDADGERTFRLDRVSDVLNNPRRQVQSLLQWSGMAGRYQNFWCEDNENAVRNMSQSWRTISNESLPDYCRLNIENLSREISEYYRVYIRIAAGEKMDLSVARERINPLFLRVLELYGIQSYKFRNEETIASHQIEISDMTPMTQKMKDPDFSWRKAFFGESI